MNKSLKATHEGTIELGETKLKVAVLSDGTRVISANAVFKAFGRVQRSNARLINMPAFLDANNLQPFIGQDLMALIKPIDFETITGKEDSGFNASILPKLCKVYLDARNTINEDTGKPVLTKKQEPLARSSEILLLGLSDLGITALIDESTGYQYVREKDELQKILKAYIAEELLPWQKRFPDVFYKELFRLNGWDYTVNGIKKRPGVIGTWTNKLIYEQLPVGVLEELKAKTPKSQSGNYTARFFQSLTPDTGNPHLTAQIQQIVTLFQLSDNMQHMWHQFEKLKLRQSGQLELPFKFDDKGHTVESEKNNTDIVSISSFDKNLKGLLSVPPPKK